MALIAQYQHAQRLEKETPNHAERVSFAQQINVTSAADDRGQLQECDGVDDAVRGAKTFVRLAEPIEQDAVFGHAVENAIGSDNGRVHCSRKNEDADNHHKNVKGQPEQFRPGQIHR